MNKKSVIINILIVLIMFMTFLTLIIPNYCYADETSVGEDLGLGTLDGYKGTATGSQKLESKANIIFAYIRAIGTVLSVVILIIIGIKYMLGSAEEKANYKETLFPYIIGAFLLFTGSILPQLIYEFMQNF